MFFMAASEYWSQMHGFCCLRSGDPREVFWPGLVQIFAGVGVDSKVWGTLCASPR